MANNRDAKTEVKLSRERKPKEIPPSLDVKEKYLQPENYPRHKLNSGTKTDEITDACKKWLTETNDAFYWKSV